MIPRRTLCRTIPMLTLLVGCGEPVPSTQTFDVALPPPVALVSLESELIGQPSDLTVAPDGRIWVADARSKRLLSVAPDGSGSLFVGREGAGPGELRAPTGIIAGEDRIRVIDTGNGRVQDYASDGSHLGDWLSPTPLYTGATAVDLEGRLVTTSTGTDSALATVRTIGDPVGVVLRLGPLVAAGPAFFDMVSIKSRIAKGEVPDEMRNFVIPVAGAAGTIWLLVETEAEVRKYGPDGSALWTVALDVPEVAEARAEFFRRNNEDQNPARVFPLLTLRDAAEADGYLWVLMGTGPDVPATFYRLDSGTGRVSGRVTVQVPAVVTGFTIDTVRERLYLAIGDAASILAADISGVPR